MHSNHTTFFVIFYLVINAFKAIHAVKCLCFIKDMNSIIEISLYIDLPYRHIQIIFVLLSLSFKDDLYVHINFDMYSVGYFNEKKGKCLIKIRELFEQAIISHRPGMFTPIMSLADTSLTLHLIYLLFKQNHSSSFL